MDLFSDFGDNDDSDVDTLRASALMLAEMRYRMSDPQVQDAFPSVLQPIFKKLVGQLTSAEKRVKEVERYVSEYYLPDEFKSHVDHLASSHRHLQLKSGIISEGTTQRHLEGHRPSLKADYHMRAKRQMKGHHIIVDSFHFEHQQGYHRARQSREEGTHRRLIDENVCVEPDLQEQKTEQCFRLASCARNYNIYDFFVFLFGDDIDFDTGKVDAKEKIKVEDEVDLIARLGRIKTFSRYILLLYDKGELNSILEADNKCDMLLQEFHRFDEDLSVKGK
uniref:Uncharacterized protein n=1 Tax=Odontella aurita TaxID=265563 RepID=A0A6U6CKQ8_9STRA|mmetsp:Transcript_14025/g.41066  ORF Transcript_14025/g.41066 Transcript_14025/m.41066 type:complete len:278 (+) Transcript_14025:390-1223(+)